MMYPHWESLKIYLATVLGARVEGSVPTVVRHISKFVDLMCI